MGAVHGVYLKYVALSGLSIAGYVLLVNDDTESGGVRRILLHTLPLASNKRFLAFIFGYSAIINGSIALLFQMRRGMFLLGKNVQKGTIPMWSYIVWFPFHIPNFLYTYIHTKYGTCMVKDGLTGKYRKERVPVASEVLPGWWIGGRYSHLLRKKWGGIIDLTVEFPELCKTQNYLCIPIWDGVPPTPDQLEQAANFAVNSKKDGDVLFHCAHGRGRSTTTMCAALVKSGMFASWQDAFNAIKPGRPVIKLNTKMKDALTKWQQIYAKKD